MRPGVLACVLLVAALPVAAQEVPPVPLQVGAAHAHLPGAEGWVPGAPVAPDTTTATRALSGTQTLTAVLRVIPVTAPDAVVTLLKRPRDQLAEMLYDMGDTLKAMLDVPASGVPLIDASPWDYGGMWCLYYNALSGGAPVDATAGSSRDMSISGAMCARLSTHEVIDMRIADVRRMAEDHYDWLAMDAAAFFETLRFDPPAR